MNIKKFPNGKIVVRSGDHLPPHVHIRMNDGRQVLVHLHDMTIIGKIPAREIREQLKWIEDNADALTNEFKRKNP